MCDLKHPVMFILVLLLLFSSGQAYGKVYIDIDSPSFQKFPIAIADSHTAGSTFTIPTKVLRRIGSSA